MLWIAVGVVTLLSAAVLLPFLARRLVPGDHDPSALERRKAQNEIVRTGIQAMGGVFFLVTAAFAWQEIQHTQEQLRIARDGQITERFTRAIDQFGSEDPTVRIGGIYALERIAADSPADHAVVMEVLASFLRETVPVPSIDEPRAMSAIRSARPPADVQAAATVIGRRNVDNDPLHRQRCSPRGGPNFPCLIDLSRVDLSGAELAAANLDNVNLASAHLSGANLAFASLSGANLEFADLRFTNLRLADVTDAYMGYSVLGSTNLHQTDGLTCEQIESSRHSDGAVNHDLACGH
jgi:hypothetical protein